MYYIYEIPGVKIGCTVHIKGRQRKQRHKGEMIILEQHEDIMVASNREIELQREKGYPVDKTPYWKVTEKEKCSRGGVTAGNRAVESGQFKEFVRAGGTAACNNPNFSNKMEWTCPHCGKSGKARVNLVRFHGDQCKEKP